MEEQERIAQIETYVIGKMSEEDSKAFEQRLLEDANLANELKAYQEVQNFLSDTPKNHFRATLEQVREENNILDRETPSKSDFKWWWIALAILLIGGILFFFLRPQNDEQPAAVPSIESEIPEPSSPPTEVTPPAEEVQKNPKATEKPVKKPIEKSQEVIKPSRPIAANFDVNPLLENEMREGLRGGEIEVQLSQPIEKAKFSSGESVFFAGTLETDYSLDELDLQLLIFSNKVAEYQNFEPIEEQTIILNEDLTFKFVSTQNLSEGLYYFIIEDLNEEAFLKVGKFEVR